MRVIPKHIAMLQYPDYTEGDEYCLYFKGLNMDTNSAETDGCVSANSLVDLLVYLTSYCCLQDMFLNGNPIDWSELDRWALITEGDEYISRTAQPAVISDADYGDLPF